MDFVDLKTQYAALREQINARIQKVLDHGQYVMGPEVAELEQKLAGRTGAGHCIAVASGTEALLIALLALEVKPGDEVITTPFTFAATAEMIALIGAKPVFVDVEEDTANIDVAKLEAAVTPRTRAIMPVSLYGQPADMDEINAIAARRRLPVIEDAAQSFGAIYKARQSCNLSTIGCTSFFPSKPLGCYGDGGAIFTGDAALARAMREIRVHGQSGRYQHTRIGVGGRMDSIQCAVVLAKLERFDWELRQRAEIGSYYDALLASCSGVKPVKIKPDRTSVYAQYTLRVAERTAFELHMRQSGIPTAVHYPLSLHQQPAYAAGCAGQSFPVSERLAREVISLPMHADLDENSQQRIVAAVREFAGFDAGVKLLVTGAAGFIGMHSCRRLLERGHEVFGLDNLNAYYDPALKRARLEQLRQFPKFSFDKLDIAEEHALGAVFATKRFDAVLHLAAQAGVRYSLENPMAYVSSNVAGFLNILEGCRKAKIPHLCYASSSSVYGANTEMPFGEDQRVDRPVSLYAATKRAGELMAHSYAELYGVMCTGLRFFTVYGPWGRPDMALFIFTRAILEGRPIQVFNGGDMLRDFTYVDDIVEAVTALVERPHPGAQGAPKARLFNIGHGSPVKLMDFVHAVERALGRKALIELAPMQPGDVRATYASTEKLRAEIGYAPSTAIETGVERFIAWYRSYYAGGPAA